MLNPAQDDDEGSADEEQYLPVLSYKEIVTYAGDPLRITSICIHM